MTNWRFHVATLVVALAGSGCTSAKPTLQGAEASEAIGVRLIRSATVLVTYKNAARDSVNILVDPILADEGTEPPIEYSNGLPNPRIQLPIDKYELLKGIQAVLLTHYHSDHFDGEAERIVPKDTLIFCQPYDEARLREKGFTNLRVIRDVLHWEGLTISRFLASHYQGATGAPPFGESSSYSLQTKSDTVFFTGDAILDDKLKSSLQASNPRTIVANAGACQFTKENPLLAPGMTMTLTAHELKETSQLFPHSTVVAVHMDAINHCPLTKTDLRKYVEKEGLRDRILIPTEGDAARP